MRILRPAICVVTRGRGDEGSDERSLLLRRLSAAAAAGATMVQVRERQFDDRRLLEFVRQVIVAVRPAGTAVLVNDRTDIALAAGADGVHLKSDAPSAAAVRRIVPAGFAIGRSVHTVAEATLLETADACDYLFFGTVFPSSSKPADHPVAGVEALGQVCAASALPVIAIGGLSVERAAAVARAGAAGVAAIGLFAETTDPAATVHALRAALTLPSGNV